MPLLIFYYLVSPLLIRLLRYLGWYLIVIIAVFQLVLLNIVYPGVLGFQFPGWMSVLSPPVLATSLAEWAIFFPLGLVYIRYMARVTPVIQKLKWALVVITSGLYVVALLDFLAVISFPIARYLCPVSFILLTPIFNRNSIPMVKQFEVLGKRAYGLYLMNLIVLDILLVILVRFVPGLAGYYLLLLPVLLILAIEIPLLIMKGMEHSPRPLFNRYVFG